MSRLMNSSSSSYDLVLKILRKNIQPLSAYSILEKVQKFGIKSPPIIYRALEKLIKLGKVHKINELNSFIACDCNDKHNHLLSVLTICQNCTKVSEIHDQKVIDHLVKLKMLDITLIKDAVIELPVTCNACVKN